MSKIAESKKMDTTVVLPKQVRDQIAAASEHYAIPGDKSQIEDAIVIPQDAPRGEQPPVPSQPGSPPPQSPTPAPIPAEDQSWEQRYNSLRGRYDTLTRNYSDTNKRMNDMEALIASMQARGAEPTPDTDPANLRQDRARLVTEEEENDYGKDMLDVVGRRAREEVLPEVEQLRGELANLKGRLEGVGTVMAGTRQQQMYDRMDAAVPEWQNINQTQEFIDWLQNVDAFSGRKKHDLLLDAFSRQETNRVLSFFQGFLAEASGLPPIPPSPGNAAPPLAQPGNGSGKPSLEDFAAPGRARSAPQVTAPDKPNYTTAQIAKFMADKRTGKWRGREAEADAIEADIYLAQHEGRITQ